MRAVLEMDVQAQTERRRTKADKQFAIASALYVIEAVAQHHSDGIASLLQVGSHIVRIEPHALVVIRNQGSELALPYLPAVQGELIKSQTADRSNGFLYLLLCHKLLAQEDAFLCQGIHIRPGFLHLGLLQLGTFVHSSFGQTGIRLGNDTYPSAFLESGFGIRNDELRVSTPCRGGISLIPHTDTPRIVSCLQRSGQHLAL